MKYNLAKNKPIISLKESKDKESKVKIVIKETICREAGHYNVKRVKLAKNLAGFHQWDESGASS